MMGGKMWKRIRNKMKGKWHSSTSSSLYIQNLSPAEALTKHSKVDKRANKAPNNRVSEFIYTYLQDKSHIMNFAPF